MSMAAPWPLLRMQPVSEGSFLAGGPSFCWTIELPARGAHSGDGCARPRAALVLTSFEGGDERLEIPVAVARSLGRAAAEGLQACSRPELMRELGAHARSCAAKRAEALVAARDYSRFELDRKLADDGYEEGVRREVLDRYEMLGIVDDARYGSVYVRSKLSAGWGPQRIERELGRRGVDIQSVPGWPEEFLEDDAEEERAYRLASSRRVAERNGYEKLVRYLCGRGYSVSCAKRAARRVVREREEADSLA